MTNFRVITLCLFFFFLSLDSLVSVSIQFPPGSSLSGKFHFKGSGAHLLHLSLHRESVKTTESLTSHFCGLKDH